MMPLLNLIQGGIQFALYTLGYSLTEKIGYFIGRQTGQGNFTGAFEQSVNRKVPAEDNVAAKFNLGNEIISVQVHFFPFFL